MRAIAAMLIVAQALAPAAAWGQDTRAAPKSPAPAAAPKGPTPAPAPAAAPAQAPAPAPAAKGPPAAPSGATTRPVVDRRLALIVGNNTYQNAPLVNPINDARLVAKTLEGLGFEVMLRENLNLRDFKAVMRQFASRLENEEGTGLLYYAGHGVQIEGRNFLLPIDVGTGDEYELRDSSVDLEDTLMSRLVRARKRERIIILDACRDNPFRAPQQQHRALLLRGFAQMGSEKGSLIVYSTNPGNTAEDGTGKNSIFTEFFVREIQKDGVEVGQALRSVTSAVVGATKGRQTPWYNSSLLGEFYFRPIDQKLEEERRKKEVQAQVEAALKAAREDLKRDEATRIAAAIAEREKEREREKQERERQYNAQLAEMKALLERRDKDLENARMQVAMAAKTRDEQLAVLATVETERRQLERERLAAAGAKSTQPVARQPADDAAAKAAAQADAAARTAAVQADAAAKAAERQAEALRERREREAREERERLQKLEAQRQAAADKAQREEAERQAKAAADIARREAAAKTQRERDERDQLRRAEAQRKAAEQARRQESERQAKAAAEQIRALEEDARKTAERDQLARADAARKAAEREQLARADAAGKDAAGKAQRDQSERERLANARAKKAKEDADRAVREAETRERLAKIEEEVRRKASLEYELLNRKATLPPELAALMVNEVQKMTVPGTSGDFVVRGIKLPADVAVKPAAPNVPANCSAFLGAWGNGRWNGERTAEIWVESVEADCRARTIYARGGLGMSGEQPTFQRGDARISGNRLTLELGAVRIELTREGDHADGRWSSGVNSATARFDRLPAAPDRTIALFANEAADFGARPSRVISASQVNVNERTRIATMLPLPTAVPGIDTLTTVQLDAFLKANPGTVLVDAFVGAAHRTLPGAFWLPELGSVTVGQKELKQIEDALQAASGGDLTRPIVVFERSSTYGWFGYHGVLRLLGMGYKNIYWYRGGLDAWHDAQFPLAQAEPWTKAR